MTLYTDKQKDQALKRLERDILKTNADELAIFLDNKFIHCSTTQPAWDNEEVNRVVCTSLEKLKQLTEGIKT